MRVILFFLFITFSVLASGQNDKVHTKAGVLLVGEIKGLRRTVLTFDADYADSEFKVDWEEVDALDSDETFLIFMDDGARYTGSFKPLQGTNGLIRIIAEEEEVTVLLEDIVEITALEKTFVQRIRVSLDAGFSFTKANHSRQLSINGKVNYQSENWALNGSFNKVGSYQDNVDATSRTEGSAGFTYFILGNSFAFSGLEFLRNSEQKLDLRSTAKLGIGYYFFRTNHFYFGGGAGFAGSSENYGGDNPSSSNSLEGLGVLELNAYNIGDLSVESTVSAYPSFTNRGRVRIDANVAVKYEFPYDIYIKLDYIHNFDSEPPSNVPKRDFVFQSTIGWEWN